MAPTDVPSRSRGRWPSPASSRRRAQQAADDVRVLEPALAANAHIGRKSSAFFVRFDRPVDHRKSTLVIKQGDTVIERLHPWRSSCPSSAT